ncbi:MAG: OmpH family outer membrane protein [Flavobacteriales bacterium]
MKNSKTLLILAFVTVMSAVSFAQKMKFGYVNTNDIFMTMPQRDTIEMRIRADEEYFRATLEKMKTEYMTAAQALESKKATMSATQLEVEAAMLQSKEQEFAQFSQAADAKLQEEQVTLFEPLQKKVKAAIEKVAKANLYTYIVDSSTLLYVDTTSGTDITDLVKKELGIVAPATAPATK